jgi:hypothetical protein
VLELLIEQAQGRDLNVIHAEPFADVASKDGDVTQATPAPIIAACNLTFEPALFAIDAAGIVVDWLGFVWDAKETGLLLDAVAPRN